MEDINQKTNEINDFYNKTPNNIGFLNRSLPVINKRTFGIILIIISSLSILSILLMFLLTFDLFGFMFFPWPLPFIVFGVGLAYIIHKQYFLGFSLITATVVLRFTRFYIRSIAFENQVNNPNVELVVFAHQFILPIIVILIGIVLIQSHYNSKSYVITNGTFWGTTFLILGTLTILSTLLSILDIYLNIDRFNLETTLDINNMTIVLTRILAFIILGIGIIHLFYRKYMLGIVLTILASIYLFKALNIIMYIFSTTNFIVVLSFIYYILYYWGSLIFTPIIIMYGIKLLRSK